MLVSSAATENKINVIYCPKKSSRKIEANTKFIFTPNKIISRANNTNNRLGFRIKIKMEKNTKRKDKNKT